MSVPVTLRAKAEYRFVVEHQSRRLRLLCPADSAPVRTDQQALYNIYTLSRRAGTTVVEMGSKNRTICLKYRDNMVDMDMYILRVRYRYFEQTVMLVPSSGKRKSIDLVSASELSVGWVDPWVGLGWVHYSKSAKNLKGLF